MKPARSAGSIRDQSLRWLGAVAGFSVSPSGERVNRHAGLTERHEPLALMPFPSCWMKSLSMGNRGCSRAACLHQLRRRNRRGVISFSDPVPRTTVDGRLVFVGHFGTIDPASNAPYWGRTEARTLRLLPDATVYNARALQKVRGRERGWEYTAEQLVRYGAEPLKSWEDSRAWLARWLPRLTRPLYHAGNHRYAWTLSGERLSSTRPYPKKTIC